LGWQARRVGAWVAVALAWGHFDLQRLDGLDGDVNGEVSYRWQPTAEDLFQAERAASAASAPSSVGSAAATGTGTGAGKTAPAQPLKAGPGDWTGFRGPDRDSRLTGVRISRDWAKSQPKAVWRRRVGPGWSSFAVIGDRLYTQEQRGKDEAVVCYSAADGSELWVRLDEARFEESIAGPGPRGTPTFHEGRIYALGATGRLNCLDARTGAVIWSRNVLTESGAKPQMWGYAGSPLVSEGLVTVFTGGPDDKGVAAYDALTGKPAWSAGDPAHCYASTQRAKLAGVDQLLINTGQAALGFDPVKGTVLWRHDLPLRDNFARCTQPTVVDGTDLLVGAFTDAGGLQRLRLSRGPDGKLSAAEVWSTKAIRPYYNDLVLHNGHLYAFDKVFLVCADVATGVEKWRVRGYANGQVLLLADQGLLLVLTEKGEVALVEADPAACKEVGRFPALKGKTWNHPVLAHGRLFVRNGEEMACYAVPEEAAAGR
jgi:outer membrane protein assembly factor BamB